MSTSSTIIFDPIQEICHGRSIHMSLPFYCVYEPPPTRTSTSPTLASSSTTSLPPPDPIPHCHNILSQHAKSEALLHAAILRKTPLSKIAWAQLWKFVISVHCVHHFSEAVEFALKKALDALEERCKEARAVELAERREREWMEELQRAEEKEEARRERARQAIGEGDRTLAVDGLEDGRSKNSPSTEPTAQNVATRQRQRKWGGKRTTSNRSQTEPPRNIHIQSTSMTAADRSRPIESRENGRTRRGQETGGSTAVVSSRTVAGASSIRNPSVKGVAMRVASRGDDEQRSQEIKRSITKRALPSAARPIIQASCVDEALTKMAVKEHQQRQRRDTGSRRSKIPRSSKDTTPALTRQPSVLRESHSSSRIRHSCVGETLAHISSREDKQNHEYRQEGSYFAKGETGNTSRKEEETQQLRHDMISQSINSSVSRPPYPPAAVTMAPVDLGVEDTDEEEDVDEIEKHRSACLRMLSAPNEEQYRRESKLARMGMRPGTESETTRSRRAEKMEKTVETERTSWEEMLDRLVAKEEARRKKLEMEKGKNGRWVCLRALKGKWSLNGSRKRR